MSVTIRGDTRIEMVDVFEVTLRQRGGPSFLVDPLTRSVSVEIHDNDGGETVVRDFQYNSTHNLGKVLCYSNLFIGKE